MFSLCICTTYQYIVCYGVFFSLSSFAPHPIQVNTLNQIISIAIEKQNRVYNFRCVVIPQWIIGGIDTPTHTHTHVDKQKMKQLQLFWSIVKNLQIFLWVSVKRRAHRKKENNSNNNNNNSNDWGKNVKIGQSSGWVIDTIVWYWIFGCMNVAFLSDPIKMEINSCSKVSNAKQKRGKPIVHTHTHTRTQTQTHSVRSVRWNASEQGKTSVLKY